MDREPFHPGLDHPRDTLADGTDAYDDDFGAGGADDHEGPRMGVVVWLVAFALIVAIGLTLR